MKLWHQTGNELTSRGKKNPKHLFHSPMFFCWCVFNSFLVDSCFLVARLREVLVTNSTLLTFAEAQKWLSKHFPLATSLGGGQKLAFTQSSFLLVLTFPSLRIITFSLCVQSLFFCYFCDFSQLVMKSEYKSFWCGY